MLSAWSRPPGIDQILLQGVYTEGVGNRVLRQLTVRTIGAHMEGVVFAQEGGGGAEILEGGARKIPEYRLRCRRLHGQVVVRALPVIVLIFMASRAGGSPHIAVVVRGHAG
ncbi:hypothetical protein [Marinobacter lipolyticus]|uniref:hypothetical protein n=1 Tax=Marinobacter lipolyticus TaxID=209639 RepID=UPI001BCC593F|nr:hypothetical protein [Marinobacter lipolyticus]